ncbi:MAG: thioredoxin domain-containing protein [Patescibacteria group bacterium]
MDVLQKFSIPLAIIIAGVFIAGALYFGGNGNNSAGQPSAGQPSVPSANVDVKKVKIGASDPFIGKKNAPVTLVYWFDYQCPYCKAVDVGGIPQIPIEPAMPALIKDYVETGKLKVVFKDYAFLGPDSMTAAVYMHAVWELYPDKFYKWHEAMLVAQDEEHGGFGDEASIVKLTRTISGLDADRLKQQVASKLNTYTEIAKANQQEGTSFGIQGTPGFITGKQLIPGAAQFSTFKSAIDAQL